MKFKKKETNIYQLFSVKGVCERAEGKYKMRWWFMGMGTVWATLYM